MQTKGPYNKGMAPRCVRFTSFGVAILAIACTDPGAVDPVNDDPSEDVPVEQIRGCDAVGVDHRGTIGSQTWTARQSPHTLIDTVTVTGKLTIEAGAFVCARPHARLFIKGGQLEAIGRADRRIHFVALDTVTGWQGIAAGSPTTEDGGSITIKYADVDYAGSITAGFTSVLTIEHALLRRTFAGTGGNLTGFFIRHSEVNDANVLFSSGTFEETIIRRGSLTLFPAQPGAGGITLNGGRIEESPGVALTIGSLVLIRVPTVTVAKAPEIVGSRGGIGEMPSDVFFALWPTPASHATLADNVNKRVSLWGPSFGDLYLSRGLDWNLASPLPSPQTASVTLEAGATVHLQAHVTVNGPFTAVGTEAEPIVISSQRGCWGTNLVCGFTLRDTANARLAHVMLRDAYLR